MRENSVSRRSYLSTVAAVTFAGCTAPTAKEAPEIQRDEFEFVDLPYENWPQFFVRGYCDYSLDEAESLDLVDHPKYGGTHALGTARELTDVAQCLHFEDESTYRPAVRQFAERIVDYAHEDSEGNLFLPSEFDYKLHGKDAHQLHSPVYGCMSLGEALSAFSRLYHLTSEDWYLDIANKLFGGLSKIRDSATDEIWVTTVDNAGYLWFEEYPTNPPAHTLNGKIFAIFGLNEYWQVTGSADAEELMEQATTTVIEYFDEFRVSGNLSYYCLGHKVQSEYYHMIHARQMKALDVMTGGEVFSELEAMLLSDFEDEDFWEYEY